MEEGLDCLDEAFHLMEDGVLLRVLQALVGEGHDDPSGDAM